MNDLHKGPWYPDIESTQILFDGLNEVVFDNKLPNFDEIVIKQLRGGWGSCYVDEIIKTGDIVVGLKLNKKFPSFDYFVSTLGHEMIHLHQLITEGIQNHGLSFRRLCPRIRQFCNTPIYERG